MRFYNILPIYKVRIWRRRLQMAVNLPGLLAVLLCGLSLFGTLWLILAAF